MDSNFLSVILSLVLSAFFSATEIAFLSANKLHVAIQKKKGKGKGVGAILSKFYDNESTFITTILIGNTVALVVYGIYMAAIIEPPVHEYLHANFMQLDESSIEILTLTIQTIVSTIVVLATAEFLPKNISLAAPDKFLTFAAFPMNIIYIVSYPVTWIVKMLSKFTIVKIMKQNYSEGRLSFSLADLGHYLQEIDIDNKEEGETTVDKKILANAVDFKEIRVKECMIPRKEIIAISIEDSIEDITALFNESGHSKIPVYKESIDDIIGYCHIYHLFKKPADIKDIITEIVTVPETMSANDLMVQMIAARKSLALVVDEFGGTSGIATMEDIIEEIFGEIEDEHDEEEAVIQKLDDYTYILGARQEIDFLNEEYNWNLPEGDYETLGGLILDINHDVPQVGDTIEGGHFEVEVISMENARIDMVKLIFNPKKDRED